MLEVKNLVKKFGSKTAIDNLNFVVNGGEVVGLLGPNGAGKTTAISIIGGVMEPTGGCVKIDGKDISLDPVGCKKITSVIPEEPWLWGSLSAMEYLLFVGKIRGLDYGETKKRAEPLLNVFSLFDLKDSLVESFSMGMRQKLLWCAALLVPPRLLLLDEPFNALDPFSVRRAIDLVYEITREYKTAVLVSTHNLDIAEKISSRIIVLNEGRIIADEDKESLIKKFRNNDNSITDEKPGTLNKLETVFLDLVKEKKPFAV